MHIELGDGYGDHADVFGDGGETPRNGLGGMGVDTEREREFLEALRSVLVWFVSKPGLIHDLIGVLISSAQVHGRV
jgi:hypothetical protein